jgi:hypothetical protein
LRKAARQNLAKLEGRQYRGFKKGETKERVVQWLVRKAKRGDTAGWSAGTIAEELGLEKETAKKCLLRLANEFPDNIARVGRGLYRCIQW